MKVEGVPFEEWRARIAREMGVDPEQLTNDDIRWQTGTPSGMWLPITFWSCTDPLQSAPELRLVNSEDAADPKVLKLDVRSEQDGCAELKTRLHLGMMEEYPAGLKILVFDTGANKVAVPVETR